MDIADALTGRSSTKRRRIALDDASDDDLDQILSSSITKRNVKAGTKLLKNSKQTARGQLGGGSFQSMGLHPSLLRSLTLQGFRVPTPIQRQAIPVLLADPPRDLVAMARTGSGKSLAFILPLIHRLGGRHATSFGARALILLPTRELALQLFKVGKQISRGFNSSSSNHAGDHSNSAATTQLENHQSNPQGLKWGLVVGGEGLDEQFDMIASNPDVIIATPGRLLHLVVEMNLDLKSVQYVVFDEADRLFEMGFETALGEILNRLPTARQTLLFSATLPKSLVEFAKAGLKDPKLVRLDTESKISPDLKMAFFSVKTAEKDACLLSLLRDVIRIPYRSSDTETKPSDARHKNPQQQSTLPHQTLIFAATKHHVEYLTNLLITANYSVSHIYGTLDQAARTHQMDLFRRGVTSILVVTDVAARGIDIPVLENVVNYDFPHGARVFVHRVGRTARAGRKGWAWSLLTHTDLPYLLDLQLFLARPITSEAPSSEAGYTESLVLGTFERDKIDPDVEYIRSLHDINHSLDSLRDVMKRGHTMYERTRGKASPASYVRAKEMSKDSKWMLVGSHEGIHPVLSSKEQGGSTAKVDQEKRRQELLKTVSAFRPGETVFESSGTKNAQNAANAALMRERRKALNKSAQRAALNAPSAQPADEEDADPEAEDEDALGASLDVEMADEEDIAAVFDPTAKKQQGSYRDAEYYMSHYQQGSTSEKGYSLTDGASFIEQARNATFDLAGDESRATERHKRTLSWDKKKKKFVQGAGIGADNKKLVKTESGTKLPATYRSGRFDEWKQKTRVSLPRVGEVENEQSSGRRGGGGGRRFKHTKVEAAKPLDRLGKDYERKSRQRDKRQRMESEGDGGDIADKKHKDGKSKNATTRYGNKTIGKVKSELKTRDQIHKTRKMVEKRKLKNARPSKAGKFGGGGKSHGRKGRR